MKKNIKIAVVGSHGVGKSTICKKVFCKTETNIIKETFSDVLLKKLKFDPKKQLEQSEELTLATFSRQLYLENLYTVLKKNIVCDRSLIDCFIYNDFHSKKNQTYSKLYKHTLLNAFQHLKTYDKIYLIEPSDRPVEDNGIRMTGKEKQLAVHNLFLKYLIQDEYMQDLKNIVVVNQEEQNRIVDEIVDLFINEIN